ncbi:arsenic metallochaperone ArsD family protein, partial [Propionibacterium sp.]
VQRANLAQDPAAFAGSPVARAFMQVAGADGLPLVVVDGVAVSTNRYPSREELAVFAGLASAAGCCSGDAAGANAPGCCGSNNDSTGPSTEGSSCCGGSAPQALPLENTSGSAVQL